MEGDYEFPINRLRPLRDPTKTPVVLVACGSFSPITILHLRMFEMARDHARHRPHNPPSSPAFEIVGGYLSLVNDAYRKPGLAPAVHRFNMCRLACGRTSDWIMVDPWEARQEEYVPTARVLDHFWEELNEKGGGVEVRPRVVEGKGKGRSRRQSPSGTGEKGTKKEDGVGVGEGTSGINGVKTDTNGVAGQDKVERRQVQIILLAGTDLVQSMGQPGVWTDQDLDHILGRYGIYVIERPESNLDLASLLSPTSPNHISDPTQLSIPPTSPLLTHRSHIYLVPQPVRNDVSSTKVRLFLQNGMSVEYLTPGPVVKYIKGHGLFRPKREKRRKGENGTGSAASSGEGRKLRSVDLVQTPPPVDQALLEKLWREAEWHAESEADGYGDVEGGSSEDEEYAHTGSEDEEAAVVVNGVLRTGTTPGSSDISGGSRSGSGSEAEGEGKSKTKGKGEAEGVKRKEEVR